MEIVKDIIVYEDEGYNAFPSIAKTKDGAYLIAFRHAPDRRAELGGVSHVDPEARVYIIQSTDGCKTWSKPYVIDRPGGWSFQDPCLNILSDGTILMTTFLWKCCDEAARPMLEKVLQNTLIFETRFGGITYGGGSFTYISRDGGQTWEGPNLISERFCIRGRCVELPDGTILAPVYGGTANQDISRAAIYASYDKGITWEPYTFLTEPLGESCRADEPTLFRTKSGRIFCYIRTATDGMYCCYSDDDGRTFSEPSAVGLSSRVPYHPLQLPSGNVLLSYGHREAPYGIRGQLLDGECGGLSPENEFILRDDGLGRDLSYTWAETLPNGDILCIYYFYTKQSGEKRYIAGTILRE